jgi:Uma2 family endonuclease
MVTAQQLAERMPDTRDLLSDEPQMETTQHYQQLALLVSDLEWHWRDRADFFIGANLTVYYTHEQLQFRRFLGPDFFLVREVDPRPRASWVVWNEEGRYPDLIIELLSDSTANVDRASNCIKRCSAPRSISGFRRSLGNLPDSGWPVSGIRRFQPMSAVGAGAKCWGF